MSALCRAYEEIADAERAVEGLLAGGVPGVDVRLLIGAEMHDARREREGRFVGDVGTESRVGTFAGDVRRDAARGNFAGGGSRGEGVFGNADRDVVVTYSDGREHSRVTGHRHLRRLLLDAGLDEQAADADVRALHDGRVLVLVKTDAVSAARAAELVDAAVV